MKALYIEDDILSSQNLVEYLSVMLSELNIKTIHDASEAYKEIDNISKYDIVILDIMMRRHNVPSETKGAETGVDIYNFIRKKSSIPIIIVSGLSKNLFWSQLTPHTNTFFFKKPIFIAIDDVVSKIKEIIYA